jgi:thiopeptide-type bacteriocin biosynthesis protein
LASAAPDPLPDAFSIAGTVVAPSAQAVAEGEFLLSVHGVVGPSGARMLGRFASVDAGIEALVRRHLEAEEALQPGVVFAELVHLPEGRMGNVIARPVLRGHELPFLGQSGARRERQIPLEDLLVSVRGGRIQLRSASLGVEVVPRLTNAHNFRMNATAPYRFLATIQQDGVSGSMGWSWGALSGAPFLPRVVVGRLLLARAQWTLVPADVAGVVAAKSPGACFRAAQSVRETRRMPRWVVIAGGDNELPVDLDTVAGCELLAHEARRAPVLLLKEIVGGPGGMCAEGPDGRFSHELLVPLVRTRPPTTPPVHAVATVHQPGAGVSESAFPPGSAWLSARLQTGKATADGLLLDLVRPLVDEVVAAGAAERWFFIRYGDPDWHLRLRFGGDPDRLAAEVLPLLRRHAMRFLDDGRLARLELHPYEREVARYGGTHGMPIAEAMFQADSEATLAILAATRTDDGLDARWRLALAGCDAVLADLGLTLDARQREVRMWRDAFAEEFGADGVGAKRFAGNLLRRERKTLEPLLDGSTTDPVLRHGLAALRVRSATLRPAFEELRALDAAGRLANPAEDIGRSLVHMHCNRVLRGAHRLQELVIYDLLDRLYSAAVGRRKATR